MQETANLRVRVTADGIKQTDGDLRNLAGAGGVAEKAIVRLTGALSVAAAGAVALKAVKLADEWQLMSARVNVAAGDMQQGAQAMGALFDMAQRLQVGVGETTQVFQRLNQSILQMGGNQADTLALTDLLGKSIKVSGAGAQEAAAAMLQFGQAMGSGKLAGDELRSLMESAPYLMRQLADGLGVPVGKLKELGAAGELTADKIMAALTKASDQINRDFEQMPQVLSGAVAVMGNETTRLAAAFDQGTNASAAMSGVVLGLSRVMDSVTDSIMGANGESERMARANYVAQWADVAATGVSYVVDAVDFLIRGLKQAGTLIGGVMAAAASLVRGDLSGAGNIAAMVRGDIAAIGSGPLMGEKFRNRPKATANAPAYTPSQLKAPADDGTPASKKGGKSSRLGGGKEFAPRLAPDTAHVEAWEAYRRKQEQVAESITRNRTELDQMAAAMVATSSERERLAYGWQLEQDGIEKTSAAYGELMGRYDELTAQSRTWQQGASNALRQYADDATNYGKMAEEAVASGINGMSSSLADFVLTGKASFGDFVQSVLGGIAKMMAQMVVFNALKAGATSLSGMGGFAGQIGSFMAGAFGGARANGGPVSGGKAYLVGERGPEIFQPTGSGRIVPNSALGGGVSVQIINNTGAQVSTKETTEGGRRRVEVVVGEAVAGELRRSGSAANRAMRQGFGLAPALIGR